ncbi:hypothetical protein [Pseudoalteromonas sp. BDTF-M6]|uniref:hypothetical protein n=1 Tax=Pseudoalteromonas sp. BDTF-M6 TaxID=2796132 RepID=UPI001BB0AF60|nr:hypothetical protein [Pseudoalteromonas sp. BDTF-M6]MBS3797830.1 hypothetical protein [Pseudoalteromonas sp. BDTF-M6]
MFKGLVIYIFGIAFGVYCSAIYYQYELSSLRMQSAQEAKQDTEMFMKVFSRIHLGYLEAAQEGEKALFRRAYYGYQAITEDCFKENALRFRSQFIEFLEQDCKEGVISSCANLGSYYLEQQHYDKALPLLKKSAETGNKQAIGDLVDLYLSKDWQHANPQIAKQWILKLSASEN